MKALSSVAHKLWFVTAICMLAGQQFCLAQSADSNTQAVSQTGLLPIYAIDLSMDDEWIDGTQFPSQSGDFANFGVNSDFQQVWDKLKPSGFSSIRFEIDTTEPEAAAKRLANLCVWSRNTGVRLIPVLTSSADSGTDKFSAFSKALVSELQSNDGQYLHDYSQILAFQVGSRANIGEKDAVSLAAALRKAELEALHHLELYATPIMIEASFDYELAKAGAMAGVDLTDTAFDEAYGNLKQFISTVAASSDVDLLAVEWLPGSVGAGTVDKLPMLLDKLKADLNGKQMLMVSGFSTAFSTPADQSYYSTVAFSNLADYRARDVSDSSFLGLVYRRGFGAEPEPTPPSEDMATKMQQWDLSKKAKELAKSWSGTEQSSEMDWWLKKVESNMALVSLSTDDSGDTVFESQPAQESLEQIAAAVSEADVAMETYSYSYPAEETGGSWDSGYSSTGTPGTSYRQKLREGMMGLLDVIFQKIGEKVASVGTDTGYGGFASSDPSGGWTTGASYGTTPEDYSGTYQDYSSTYPESTASSAVVTASDVSFNPTSPKVDQQVTCKFVLQNSGQTDVSGLNVALFEDGYLVGPDAQVADISVPAGGSRQVEMPWIPDSAGSLSLSADVYDMYWNKLTSAPVSLTVAEASDGGSTWDSSTQTASSTTDTSVSTSGNEAEATEPGLEIASADISYQPVSPHVGEQVKLDVTVHNKGNSDESDIELYLVDENDQSVALAYAQDVSVAKKASKKVSVNWVPDSEKSYPLILQAWQGYYPVATVAVGPISVAAASEGSGGSPGEPGGTPGEPGGSGGTGGGVVPGLKIRPELLATTVPRVPMPKGPGGNIVPLSGQVPVGLPVVRNLDVGWSGDVPMQKTSATVSFSIANPYSTPMSNVVATLMVNGKQVDTKTIGTLLPKQERTAMFQTGDFASSGRNDIAVELQAGTNKLKGTLTGQLALRPRMAAAEGGIGQSGVRKRVPGVQTAMNATRSVLPPAFNIGGKTMQTGAVPPPRIQLPTAAAAATAKIATMPGATTPPKGEQKPVGVRPITIPGVSSTVTQQPPAPPPSPAPTAKTAPSIPGVTKVTPPPTTTVTPPPTTAVTPSPPTIPGVTPSAPTATLPTRTTTPTAPTPTVSPTVTLTTISKTPVTTPTGSAARTPTTVLEPKTPIGTIAPTTATEIVKAPTTAIKTPLPTTITPSTTTEIVKAPTTTVSPTPTTITKTPTTTVSPMTTAPTTSTSPTTVVKTTTVRPTPTTTTTMTRITPKPDLSLASADIKRSPTTPKAGDVVTFTITVRNPGTGDATGAKLLCILKADSRETARKEFTLDVKAGGTRSIQWAVTAPSARQMVMEASVTLAADTNTTNNKASTAVAVSR